jgi:hypothetical protein
VHRLRDKKVVGVFAFFVRRFQQGNIKKKALEYKSEYIETKER